LSLGKKGHVNRKKARKHQEAKYKINAQRQFQTPIPCCTTVLKGNIEYMHIQNNIHSINKRLKTFGHAKDLPEIKSRSSQ